MLNRRQFLMSGALLGASIFLPPAMVDAMTPSAAPQQPPDAQRPAPSRTAALPLDPLSIPKYQRPMVIPPAMPRSDEITGPHGELIDYYEIAVRQFAQEILPAPLPQTTVWGYGSLTTPGTFNYPSFTIEAHVGKPVRVKWVNQLVDGSGNYLPHLLPVDPTLHWANPPGPMPDMRPTFTVTPGAYTGPVPMVVHVHGAHAGEESDGYAEAWWLPNANNLDPAYFKVGSKYEYFRAIAEAKYGQAWGPGFAVFQYQNEQRGGTVWYHDHTLGMTRVNVYAGPAGFYLLRDGNPLEQAAGELPGPAPQEGDAGGPYYEIPIAVQDRSFYDDGSLRYPASRIDFDGFSGPFVPGSDMAPIWNPEVFSDTIVVNGRTWPYLEVEPRRYRFRFLNGCNARFLILKMVTPANLLAARPVAHAKDFYQIGTEGGFLPSVVSLDQLLLSPAERADVIVDFTGMSPGDKLYLINEAPDEPYGGGVVGIDFLPSNPNTTGQVMEFRVVASTGADPSTPVNQLTLPARAPLPPEVRIRQVSLNEMDSGVLPLVGPKEAVLGIVGKNARGNPIGIGKAWMDEITETPTQGDTEIWEIFNYTMDAHPIHLHEVMFEVVEREHRVTGEIFGPEPWETGLKDTVIAYPEMITRIKARFDLPGLYVWHCHIVEHEDNEMMRPYRVLHRLNFPFIAS